MCSFYRPAYYFLGGGVPLCLTDVFSSLGLLAVKGSGFLRNAVPGLIIICDEKTTRMDSFSRFRFCQTSTFISDMW